MDFKDKVVVITGANGGLGTEFVKLIASKGAKKIYATARDMKKLDKFDSLGVVQKVELDLASDASIKNAAAAFTTVDILINNAGVNSGHTIFENDWIEFDINVRATTNFTNLVQPLIPREGAIINITSILALLNLPALARYSASKAAQHSLTQALRAYMNPKGVKVFEALPGPIDTAMSEGQQMDKTAPDIVAKNIIEAVESNFLEIYPDNFSKAILEGLRQNPKGMEEEFASYL